MNDNIPRPYVASRNRRLRIWSAFFVGLVILLHLAVFLTVAYVVAHFVLKHW